MSEPHASDLLERIEGLERANRRWKLLACMAWFAALLLLAAALVFSVAAHSATRQAQEARDREQEARQNALYRERMAQAAGYAAAKNRADVQKQRAAEEARRAKKPAEKGP